MSFDDDNRIIIDFETRSRCDLKKSGSYKYSIDPSTEILCLAYKFSGRERVEFIPGDWIESGWELLSTMITYEWDFRIRRPGYVFVAHNAQFEINIYNNILVKRYGWPEIPIEKWQCTAAKAASFALPRSLDAVAQVLNLSTKKDKQGHRAMLLTAKPNRKGEFLTPATHPEVFETLYDYCKTDVMAEEALDDVLPDLSGTEQKIWRLNQKINARGIKIDKKIIERIVGLLQLDSEEKLKELGCVTNGSVTKSGATKSILNYLAHEGLVIPNLRKETVTDALAGEIKSPNARRVLELRRALSKTSTKKYQAFLDRVCPDDRIRDLTLYHGASTGRESGQGVQLQNLPRGNLKFDDIEHILWVLQKPGSARYYLNFMYGELGQVFSSLVRSMLIASAEHKLVVADYSKIEVVVLWWLADNEFGLETIRSGDDPYVAQAMYNTKKERADITSDERQLGKGLILGAGYGMSWVKFQTTCLQMYGLTLSDIESVTAIKNYREAHAKVPELWRAYGDAALHAIETPRKVFEAGKCRFDFKNDYLWVELPSGRRLKYLKPGIVMQARSYEVLEYDVFTDTYIRMTKTGGLQKTIEFQGLAPNKKDMRAERLWGSLLTENITQAVARDIMMEAVLKLDSAGYEILLTVHDEVIAERNASEVDLDDFTRIMCETPPWANDKLPLEAKGWVGERYRK